MRKDMHKVIVESPRWGSRLSVPRRFGRLGPKRFSMDEERNDHLPARIGHRRALSASKYKKRFRDHLAPLRRYLLKQVGRRWDDVWSEICSGLRLDSLVQKHLRDHVSYEVVVNTFLKNGIIYGCDYDQGRVAPISGGFYVHPLTGVLCLHDGRRGERRRKREMQAAKVRQLAQRMRVLGPGRQLHLLSDGNWWEVVLEPFTAAMFADPNRANRLDAVKRAGLSHLPLEVLYNQGGVRAVAKRPLSRKELKTLKLRPSLVVRR